MSVPRPRLLALCLALALAACNRGAAPPAPPATQAGPLSLQELMQTMVDPSADALWAAVSTETTAAGSTEHQPRTEQEWLAVRRQALTLIDGARLLAGDRLAVTKPGKTLEDAHVPGIWGAPEIAHAIAASGPVFKARAAELEASAGEALAAIDARSPARLLAAGDKIDQACERCHQVYWYPNTEKPPARWPAPLKAK
jgi:cytochrome c556